MNRQKTLIVGAGVAGRQLLKEIKSHRRLPIAPLGFIDDDQRKVGRKIGGIPVLGAKEQLKYFIQKLHITKIFIALPSIDGSIISDIFKKCSDMGIPCQTVPRVKEIIEGKVDIKRVRDVKIEDLLGRPVIKAEIEDIVKFVKGKAILVTGAAGSIGSELCRQLASYKPAQIIMYDWWENGLYELELEFKEFFPGVPGIPVIGNIQDKTRVESVIKTYKPFIIFHAAAYKHVPLMEINPIEAVKNNIFGTKILAEVAQKAKVNNFIFISTDKAVNPRNIMGITKLIGEFITSSFNQRQGTRFVSVRFGNVLDSFGSVLPLLKKQIADGGPITITDKKMSRYFMTIPEACQLILKATILGQGREVFILDMGKPIKIWDLAQKFVLLAGLRPGKDIKFKFIGRRVGEKFKEELVSKGEYLSKTKVKGIFVVKKSTLDPEKLKKLLKNLEMYSRDYNEKKIIEELKSFVKETSRVGI